MRAPDTRIFIHRKGRIAFGPVGVLELTVEQSSALAKHHLDEMKAAAAVGDAVGHDRHYRAERLFRSAVEDHSKQRSPVARP